MDSQNHWEKIYTEKAPTAVSWYRPHLETSVSLIERVATKESAIIDVGGGESTLMLLYPRESRSSTNDSASRP